MLSKNRFNAATCSLLAAITLASPVLSADQAAPNAGGAGAAPSANAATPGGAGAAPTVNQTDSATDKTAGTTDGAPADGEKIMFKRGQELSVGMDTEDITPTYDVALAQKQKDAYPDSPEASFILAVALTRTSRVEEALKEVQNARRLASAKGGPTYFDKMIDTYEKMLTNYPEENKVRYGLAWAYYMKAYLLAQQSRRAAKMTNQDKNAMIAKWIAANPEEAKKLYPNGVPGLEQAAGAATLKDAGGATAAPTAEKKGAASTPDKKGKATTAGVNNKDVISALSGSPAGAAAALSQIAGAAGAVAQGKADPSSLPHIPGALENVQPQDIPQIRAYYEKALTKIDEILQREPADVWSIVYGAHLRAEYTGDVGPAMQTWRTVASKHPNNPAPYFFLGEGYLKQGNLKESINSVSRAIALRALGN